MSLYLAVFTQDDEEIDGFQVGTYHDYGKFIDSIKENVDPKNCKLLINHHDSDGYWTPQECENLIEELTYIKKVLAKLPPQKIEYDWSRQTPYEPGNNLNASLQNIDGEPMTDALVSLCQVAVENNAKLYFQ
ncbi:Imm70 family immunity protein [Halopseudomonas salina]|uniref:Uncharacterized protein n=1 Tax=Halopseudomonas salina TaxID=1323744 RepID=A0ABQ1Q4R8_9GAMM|nr:Imm70 family immunity protein [Halopseudomonas salina]GGD12836.1 hypothetical protein GCM10007418_34620 [Halopseudomonas salina]